MKLYYADTFNARKACVVARHLQRPVDYVRVDLGKGEQRTQAFRAMNPNAKVPVLQRDDGSTLWESGAIMCELAAGTDLWPGDARQIEVLRWLHWDATEFMPVTGVYYFEHVIKPLFKLGDPDAAALADAAKGLQRYGRVLDDHLRDRAFVVGDAFTVADVALGAVLPYLPQAQVPLEEFAGIRHWHERLKQIDAWRAPF
jgi:glutathione S-transferase